MKESKDEDFNKLNWKGHPGEDHRKEKRRDTIARRWKKTEF